MPIDIGFVSEINNLKTKQGMTIFSVIFVTNLLNVTVSPKLARIHEIEKIRVTSTR